DQRRRIDRQHHRLTLRQARSQRAEIDGENHRGAKRARGHPVAVSHIRYLVRPCPKPCSARLEPVFGQDYPAGAKVAPTAPERPQCETDKVPISGWISAAIRPLSPRPKRTRTT